MFTEILIGTNFVTAGAAIWFWAGMSSYKQGMDQAQGDVKLLRYLNTENANVRLKLEAREAKAQAQRVAASRSRSAKLAAAKAAAAGNVTPIKSSPVAAGKKSGSASL